MILTLEETIAREEDIVADNERFCAVAPSESSEAYHSATYHRQIAAWLKELAKRKTGKWEIYVISMLDGEGCRCSECGFEGAPYWHYCPNCGAKMEVDE